MADASFIRRVYESSGVTYSIRYWVFDRAIDLYLKENGGSDSVEVREHVLHAHAQWLCYVPPYGTG